MLVLNLYKCESLSDILISLLAAPINIIMMLIRTGKAKTPIEHRIAWLEHDKHDKFMTIREIKGICREVLSGSILRRHLYWRYSLVWRKP